MRIGRILLGCGLLALSCADRGEGLRSFDEPLPARADEATDDWVMVFNDEFDADTLDASRWLALTGDLVHPTTMNSASPAMASVENGSLFVKAAPTPEDPKFPYTAGYLETRGLFAQTYGKIEFRARCPFAPGLWYAVWGRPWSNAIPEIDIEFIAANTTQVWFVNHWGLPPLPADDRRSFVTVNGMDIAQFHTYSVVWKTDFVEWQVDGKPYKRVTGRGVPHEPVFWIMNTWVGGWAGPLAPEVALPLGFEVDYFRVYRLREWQTDPVVRFPKLKTAYRSADTIDVDLADFDAGVHVEVWEGPTLVASMAKAPFRLPAKSLSAGKHALTAIATDGARTATASADVVVQ